MVTITDTAAEKAKEILIAEGKAEWGLRIYTAGAGCCGPSYGMDIDERPGAEDEVVEKNGIKVFIDKGTCEGLKDMHIDYVLDGDNEGFVIKGNSPPSCNCSSSSCG
ncbi:MAG: iron-sulfur cluster assembly accessory protein [Thermodesulfovibrionales bacterium]|nr:iron-sulfur cluster assembly accessory protein [Thermodesulfovibrionales bacterium]